MAGASAPAPAYAAASLQGALAHASAEQVAATVQPLVNLKGNRLEVDSPPNIGTMRADLTKVRQVLFNLLSNACKFTEKGTITLRVSGEGKREKSGAGASSRTPEKMLHAYALCL